MKLIVLGAIIVVTLYIIKMLSSPSLKKTKVQLIPFGYQLIYTDQKETTKQAYVEYSKMLYSKKYDIKGKPDYIFKQRNGKMLIPVELKSGKIGTKEQPNQGDLLQLIAYFLIIEETYGVAPKTGRLIYKDCMFIIKNTKQIRKQLIDTLDEMRELLEVKYVVPEQSFAKCKYCICRDTVCTQK